jgi:hypothetical protein
MFALFHWKCEGFFPHAIAKLAELVLVSIHKSLLFGHDGHYLYLLFVR